MCNVDGELWVPVEITMVGKADYNNLGMTYARFGKLEEAESSFNNAVQIDPEHGNAKINLANIAFRRGNYALALKQYRGIHESLAERAANVRARASSALFAEEENE
jgi:tetratricopeptide (TPR) repeat protein